MDVFNGFVLTAHMLQHMLLMMIAPPLILLGAPLVPMVRGLPIFAAREFAGPFLNWSVAKRVGSVLTNPVFALLLMGVVMFAWHTPALYELALRSPAWHQTEHACFLIASLIFWWPVVQPWPSRSQWPRWAMVPYLLIADLQNTALSAILVFSDRVLYPSYSTVPRLFRFSALEDQVAAGAIMWVVGSLAFIVPAIVIAVQCLSSKPLRSGIATTRPRQNLVVRLTPTRDFAPFSRCACSLERGTDGSRLFCTLVRRCLFCASLGCWHRARTMTTIRFSATKPYRRHLRWPFSLLPEASPLVRRSSRYWFKTEVLRRLCSTQRSISRHSQRITRKGCLLLRQPAMRTRRTSCCKPRISTCPRRETGQYTSQYSARTIRR